MSDDQNTKEDNSMRNILLAVGLAAGVAVAGTTLVTATSVKKLPDGGIVSVSKLDASVGSEVCLTGTLAQRAHYRECIKGKVVTCFGKFTHPRCK